MKFPTWPLIVLTLAPGFPLHPSYAQEPAPRPRVVGDEPAAPRAKPLPEEAPQAPAARIVPESGSGTESKRAAAETSPDEDLYNYASMLFKRGTELKDPTGSIQSLTLSIESFAKYLENYPQGKRADAALTFKGEAHLKCQDLPKAMECWREVTRKYKSGTYVAYSARQLATLLFNDEKPAEAAKLFGLAANQSAKADDKAQLHHYQGLAYQRAGNAKDAAATWELNIKSQGTTSSVYQDQSLLELARYELDTKQKSARDHFEQLTKSNNITAPTRAEAFYSLGSLDLDANAPAEAQANFEACAKIPAVGKWSALARSALIRSYAAAGQHRKVTDAWTKIDINQIPAEGRAALILAVADSYRLQDAFGSAIDLYTTLENFYPSSPEAGEAMYRKLVSLYKVKDPNTEKAAQAFLEKEKARDPLSPLLDMAQLMKAEDAFSKQKWKEASAAYKQIRSEKLDMKLRSSMFYRKGRADAESGAHAQAVESLSRFLADFPTDPSAPEVTFRRGLSYVELADITNAQKDFDAVVERYPGQPIHEEAFRYSAMLMGKTKDYSGMLNRFKEMLTTYPQSKYKGEANFWIGTGYYFLKQFRDCLEPLAYAAEVFVESKEDALQKRIMALTQLEDIDSLAKAVDAFYAGQPRSQIPGEILAYLGGKRYTEQNYADAAKFLGKAVTSSSKLPLPSAAWFQLADSRLATQDYPGTVEAANKFLEVGVNIPAERKSSVHCIRGDAYLQQKKFIEALDDANAGLKLQVEGPNHSKLLHLRGNIKLAEGDEKEAASNYGLVANLGPYDAIAADALRKLVQIFQKSGETAEVEKYRAKFKEKYPNDTAP